MEKSDVGVLLGSLCVMFLVTLLIVTHTTSEQIQNRIDILVEKQDEINTSNAQRISDLQNQITELENDCEYLSVKVDELQNKVEELEIYCEHNSKLSDVLQPTEQDVEYLEYILMSEGGYEPFECKLAILTVIINRVYSDLFPDGVIDVITQQGQFSPVANHTMFSKEPTEDVKYAVRTILNMSYNEINEEFGNILYFRVSQESKTWGNNNEYVFTKGKTDFYVQKQ